MLEVEKQIALNMKLARKAAKKTQHQVAEFCGVCRTSVANWESSLACPPLPTFILFCRCVGKTAAEILPV